MITAEHFDFTGKRVLVTGAASGIGRAMAAAFSAHGGTLVLADRAVDGLEATARDLDAKETIIYEQGDLESVAMLAERAGVVDVLMNNAGILAAGPLLEMTPQTMQIVIQVDLLGPMVLARLVAEGMVARGSGVIVNTASQLAFDGSAERAAYATAKAGLVQFTKSAAVELAPRGVRVVAIAPGRTRTGINAHILDDPEQYRKGLAKIPAGRYGQPEEMARLGLFLASSAADYIVGETVVADGGYILS